MPDSDVRGIAKATSIGLHRFDQIGHRRGLITVSPEYLGGFVCCDVQIK